MIEQKTNKLRPDLEALPDRLKSLKIDDRGYPVPWFVALINGKPEFRAADPVKLRDAIQESRCWVCGDKMGRYFTFVIGPMCGINRVSSEPPSHLECAQWSARNCPFLSNAKSKRREDETINAATLAANVAGVAIARNPGVTLLWTTMRYELFHDGRGGILFRVGDPVAIEYYANGKHATRAEVLHSIDTGLPAMAGAAASDGMMAELEAMKARFILLIPE